MELAAPGIKKEYCRVAINDEGNLTIAIENKAEHKHEDKHHHYLRREFFASKATFGRAQLLELRAELHAA